MNFWQQFSNIRCINLKDRPDRRNEAIEVFNQLQIPVNFFTAQRHPDGGQHGCFDSHIKIITESFHRGDEMCVIFEDDAYPTQEYNQRNLTKIQQFLNSNDTWEIFFFGTYPNLLNGITKKTKIPEIYQLSTWNAHAYIIHRRLMQKMIDLHYIGIPIDALYNKISESYGIIPGIFTQKFSTSDIADQSWIDYYVKPSWINFTEWYAININKEFRFLFPVLFVYFLFLYILMKLYPPLFFGWLYWIWLLIPFLLILI